MNSKSNALVLASMLTLWTLSTPVQAERDRTADEINVLVRNVTVDGKKVNIVTSLPKNSKALKWAKCYVVVQQWEHIVAEIPASKLPGTSDFWIVDEHNMQRFEDTRESIACPRA